MLFTTRQDDYVYVEGNTKSSSVFRVRYLTIDPFRIPLVLFGISRTQSESAIPQSSTADTRVMRSSGLPWFFLATRNIGLVLIAMFSAWMFYSAEAEQLHQSEILASPAVGDLYFANLNDINPNFDPNFPYSIMRVESVEGETLTLQLGSIYYSHEISPFGFLTRGAYTRESLISSKRLQLSVRDARRLAQRGSIYDVKRPEGELIDGWLSTRFLHDRYCKDCMQQL